MSHPTLLDAQRRLRDHAHVLRTMRHGSLTDLTNAIDTVLLAVDAQQAQLDTQARTLAGITDTTRRLQQEQVALWGALEEMRWPDLPGVPYFVWEPGANTPTRRQIPASEVIGIYAALRAHVATLLPWAVQAVQDHYSTERLADENQRLRVERAALADAVHAWGEAEDPHGPEATVLLQLAREVRGA